MDNEEYKMTQEMLLMLARQVRLLKLGEFLRAIDRAETLGPSLDPTLYRASLYDGNLERIKRLAEGAVGFKRAADKIVTEAGGDRLCPNP